MSKQYIVVHRDTGNVVHQWTEWYKSMSKARREVYHFVEEAYGKPTDLSQYETSDKYCHRYSCESELFGVFHITRLNVGSGNE